MKVQRLDVETMKIEYNTSTSAPHLFYRDDDIVRPYTNRKCKNWRIKSLQDNNKRNYGGDANTIHQNKGIPLEEAQKVYNNYMSGFQGLKKYQDFRRKDWFDKGYILLNPLTGHKAFIYDYEELLSEKRRMSEDGFWDYYREMKKNHPDCDTVQMVRHFFKRKSASEKQSINYPVQATGSMCLRYALIFFWKYLIKNNLQGKVKICVCPYDECNIEAPEEIAEEIAQTIYDCMVKAGAIFCIRCKLDADISRNKDGSLPDHWIH